MSRKKTTEYLNRPYSRILIPNDDGTFFAEVMEFPGCFAEGETKEEALENLEKAATEWIESQLRGRREIVEPFNVRGFNGAVSVRLPRGLHRQAARMAEREGTSLNQYIVTAVSARVGADDLMSRMAAAAATNVVLNLTHNQAVVVVGALPSASQGQLGVGGDVIYLNRVGQATADTARPLEKVGVSNG